MDGYYTIFLIENCKKKYVCINIIQNIWNKAIYLRTIIVNNIPIVYLYLYENAQFNKYNHNV